jgi:hypothetical protein
MSKVKRNKNLRNVCFARNINIDNVILFWSYIIEYFVSSTNWVLENSEMAGGRELVKMGSYFVLCPCILQSNDLK